MKKSWEETTLLTKQQEQNIWEKLWLSDNFLFQKVMRDPELCKQMLETILQVDIDHLVYIEKEKTVDEELDAHGIRIDVYIKDDQGTVFDIEIQTTDTGELPKRSRYYQSLIDTEQLNRGMHYKYLAKSYIIFICTFDLFNRGRHIYTFENRCIQDSQLRLQDEATKIFLNTEGTLDDVGKELKAFLNCIAGRGSDDEFTRKMEQATIKAKQDREWRRQYMTQYMFGLEMKEEGLQEGRQEGRREGRREGLQEGLQEGRQEGLQEGRQEGERKLSALITILLDKEEFEKASRCAKDEEYRKQLYEEYHIA